ncbi:bifunctional proline dehydrogenase/L-glutamate gamma-semialdehyde dehydrogenase [Jonesiaceae bacterium BS-20]|uniref:L-glutamate gamma-semialdehyde dehydrogenase n=1 Tax=Jonesiaceae bacterium BS-20 TaxID=3120821 RepID=A0AAU7DWM0_9MICO
MTHTSGWEAQVGELEALATRAVDLAHRWAHRSTRYALSPAAKRLETLLRVPGGLAFAVDFVDRVVRPQDDRIAAQNLKVLANNIPELLPSSLKIPLKGALELGGLAGHMAPGLVVGSARKTLRALVSHLIVDSSPQALGKALERLQQDGNALNINLLGEAVLGEREANRRLTGIRTLLARVDVAYVSVKISAIVAPHNRWASRQVTDEICARMRPLLREVNGGKFINFDMEEFKDLHLTLEVFTRLMDDPEFSNVHAGIVLQAYLPDAFGVMELLQAWARDRVTRGGAPIKVRLVKGANLPMELVDAELHGWESPVWPNKQATDSAYKALMEYALRPENIANVHVGIAGHNIFDTALAHLLAQQRGVAAHVEFEMLHGMATPLAKAISQDAGRLRLYVPVVDPVEFDAALSYLVRRLEEGASPENFMSSVWDLAHRPDLFDREERRFRQSMRGVRSITQTQTFRAQDREGGQTELTSSGDFPPDTTHSGQGALGPTGGAFLTDAESVMVPVSPTGALPPSETRSSADLLSAAGTLDAAGISWGIEKPFTNCADTEPDLPANQAWADRIYRAIPASHAGADVVEANTITDQTKLETVVTQAQLAGPKWWALGSASRAQILERVATMLDQRRALLLEVMASECGKTLNQGDPEVSEAVDFAGYYAGLGQELDRVEGAEFVPHRVTVVAPPWNFPISIAAGSVVGALAAGSAVILKPAGQAKRCGAVLAQVLWDAGVPREVVQLVIVDERDLGSYLVGHRAVDQILLTGGYETAGLFRKLNPRAELHAETSGKNTMIVTPHADFDLAAQDVALSAFGHAGQKCSAASLLILVGSAGESVRFRNQLLDAVASFPVGPPSNPRSIVGPLIAAPEGKLARALGLLPTNSVGAESSMQGVPVRAATADAAGDQADVPGDQTEAIGIHTEAHGTDAAAPGEHGNIHNHQTEVLGQQLERWDPRGHAERWVLRPRRITTFTGVNLWSPGIKVGVAPGTEFHQTEVFGPVLGIMQAETLDQAIEWANGTPYGLTAGLHTLDLDEMDHWLTRIEAGNLYINRTITGAIVRRQPFGGWKRSAVGAGFKAGGPNYLIGLGTWRDSHPDSWNTETPRQIVPLAVDELDPKVQGLFAVARCIFEHDLMNWLGTALLSDVEAWRQEFGRTRDVSGLRSQANVLRYLPVPVSICVAGRESQLADEHWCALAQVQLIREVAAGVLAGGRLEVHGPSEVVTQQLVEALTSLDIGVVLNTPTGDSEAGGWKLPAVDRARLIWPGSQLLGATTANATTVGATTANATTANATTANATTVGAVATASHGSMTAVQPQEGRILREELAATAGVETTVFHGDVLVSGRVTGLTYLREQAISVTAHRYGTLVAVPKVLTTNP